MKKPILVALILAFCWSFTSFSAGPYKIIFHDDSEIIYDQEDDINALKKCKTINYLIDEIAASNDNEPMILASDNEEIPVIPLDNLDREVFEYILQSIKKYYSFDNTIYEDIKALNQQGVHSAINALNYLECSKILDIHLNYLSDSFFTLDVAAQLSILENEDTRSALKLVIEHEKLPVDLRNLLISYADFTPEQTAQHIESDFIHPGDICSGASLICQNSQDENTWFITTVDGIEKKTAFPVQAKKSFLNYGGTRLAEGEPNENIKIWDVETQQVLFTLDADTADRHCSMAFNNDNSLFASATSDGHIKVWRTADGVLLYDHSVPNAKCIDFSRDGMFLACSFFNSDVVQRISLGQADFEHRAHVGNGIFYLAYTGQYLIAMLLESVGVHRHNAVVKLLNPDSLVCNKIFIINNSPSEVWFCVEMNPRWDLLGVQIDHDLHVWDILSEKKVRTLAFQKRPLSFWFEDDALIKLTFNALQENSPPNFKLLPLYNTKEQKKLSLEQHILLSSIARNVSSAQEVNIESNQLLLDSFNALPEGLKNYIKQSNTIQGTENKQ